MSKELTFSLPRVAITLDAYAKLMAYIRESYIPQGSQRFLMEVSGFGQLRLTPEGDIEVFDTFVVPQVCSRGHTSLLAASVGDFLLEVAQDDEKDPREYAVWWHSHCTGTARFSPTDHSTIASMSAASYWVSMVGNVHGDLYAQVDVFRPERRTLSVSRLAPDASDEEIEERITALLPSVREDIERQVSFIGFDEGEEAKLRHLTDLYGEERAREILFERRYPDD